MSLVLVADDEPAVLDALSGVIEDLGHDVVRAQDGCEALELARRRRPNLVVTDHMMPRLSGLELCRELRGDAHLRKVPVILLSGAITFGAPEASAFLPKPFELSDFEELVAKTLVGAPARERELLPELPRDPGGVLGWAAHELRTPLAAARIQLHMLQKGPGGDGSDKRRNPMLLLERQLFTLELVAGIVSDAGELFDGSLALRREPTDLVAIARRVVEGFRERHPDREVLFCAPQEEVRVDVDARRIARALHVLVGNALKHGEPVRRVDLEVEAAPTHASVRVTDFGKGIAAERQGELFRGLRREPKGGAGQGMELYVASEIARAHGGGITVRSSVGEGATFTLGLPRG